MGTFLLYAATAIATAVQVYWLLMWSIWGAPTSVTQYVALLGSLILLIAAVLHPIRDKIANVTAAIGLVALWCFDLPALSLTLARFPYLAAITGDGKRGSYMRFVLMALIPVALLMTTTFRVGKNLKRNSVLNAAR